MGEQLLRRIVIEAQEVIPEIGRILRKRSFERLVARFDLLGRFKVAKSVESRNERVLRFDLQATRRPIGAP